MAWTIFQPEFKSLLIGDNVKIGEKFYTIKHVEPLHPFVHNFGPIDAESTLIDKTITDPAGRNVLTLPKNYLGQFRLIVKDDIELVLKMPHGTSRRSTPYLKTKFSLIGQETIKDGMYEFYTFHEFVPEFDVTNPTKYGINLSRIVFGGYYYILEELVVPPEKYAVIPLFLPPPKE